jgi:hypothetical protein
MKNTKVKIGPETFKIEFRATRDDGLLNDSNYGYTLDQSNLIVVASDISESKQKVTALHEILHAARMIYEGTSSPKKKDDYDTWEHHFISIYEKAMLVVIRDNPELISWLQSE